MHILIPPAKNMSPATPSARQSVCLSQPSQLIVEQLQHYSVQTLQTLYHCSEKIATQEYHRIQTFLQSQLSGVPAFLLYNGLMYRQFNTHDYTNQHIQFIQDHVYITSALYGIQSATAPILPYRLDFNTTLTVTNKSLAHYWQPYFDQHVSKIKTPILSLLSSEFENVFSKCYQKQFFRIVFSENNKIHSTTSKKCRGALLKLMITENLTTIDSIKQLTINGFTYSHTEDLHTLHFKK